LKFNRTYLWGLVPLILVGLILYFFSDIVLYIILAWVVAMIGNPLMRLLRKFMNKNVAAALTLSSFILVSVLIFSIFIPPLLNQARNLGTIDYSKVAQSLEEPMQDWENWLADRGLILEEPLDTTYQNKTKTKKDLVLTQWVDLDSLQKAKGDTSKLSGTQLAILIQVNNEEDPEFHLPPEKQKNFFENAQSSLVSLINPARITGFFSSLLGFFGNFLIALMSILFISYFFLREQGLFDRMLGSLVPNKYEEETIQAINESSKLLIRYFLGILLQISIITIIVSLALTFLGVNNALLIAFFAALMNVIPYVGPLFGASFGIIITISSHLDLPFYSGMLPLLLKVVVVIGVMQMVDNFIIQPTIFGRSVKAHPLEIFIVVLVGAKLGGIIGMVVAIPAYTVLRVIGKVFFSEFKVVQRITQNL